MKPEPLSIVEKVNRLISSSHLSDIESNTNISNVQKAHSLMVDYYSKSRKFVIDAEKIEKIYNPKDEQTKNLFWMAEPDFRLPFDNCSFIFNKPINIIWRNRNNNDYVNSTLIAIIVQEVPGTENSTHDNGEQRFYQFSLIFGLGELPLDSSKFEACTAHLGVFKSSDEPGIAIYIVDHSPCINKLLCCLDSDGNVIDNKNIINSKVGGFLACPEVTYRTYFFRMFIEMVNKINEVMIIDKNPERTDRVISKNEFDQTLYRPLPWGWPFTKGNQAKDNYIQYLDNVRYRYNPENINYGTGSKHKYRYDVRRHPRIINGRIVWVSPHQRGAGEYHPKIYATKGKWYVHYIYWTMEKLTTIKVVNILLVKTITLFKSFLNRTK